jgi:hypothetical protein
MQVPLATTHGLDLAILLLNLEGELLLKHLEGLGKVVMLFKRVVNIAVFCDDRIRPNGYPTSLSCPDCQSAWILKYPPALPPRQRGDSRVIKNEYKRKGGPSVQPRPLAALFMDQPHATDEDCASQAAQLESRAAWFCSSPDCHGVYISGHLSLTPSHPVTVLGDFRWCKKPPVMCGDQGKVRLFSYVWP